MQRLSQIAVEVIGSAWLVIVSVQYVSRYFVEAPAVDLTYTYVGIVFLLVALSAVRILRDGKDCSQRDG